jgi:tetratricopeptide (TPR) repeat protein
MDGASKKDHNGRIKSVGASFPSLNLFPTCLDAIGFTVIPWVCARIRTGGQGVDYQLKHISPDAIAEAVAKAELYRSLNEPEEAESICRDILAVEPRHQLALRLLGLALTDQFTSGGLDRYRETERIFEKLQDPYERLYYTGILYERRAKAQLNAGNPPAPILTLFEEALRLFAEAERIRPAGNDDAILRWNRCVRLLQNPAYRWEEFARAYATYEPDDAPPR